jgi:hypothetical protein
MMKRSLLYLGFLTALVIASGGRALTQGARTTPSFYIVLNSLTKTCSVVDKTPKTDTPNITVASDAVYKTRAEAEAAANLLPSCKR